MYQVTINDKNLKFVINTERTLKHIKERAISMGVREENIKVKEVL